MIRAAEPSDAPRIAEIHVFGWRCAYRGILTDAILFGKMQVQAGISRFERAIAERAEETYVYDDGICKAFMTIGPCRDDDAPHAFELWGIYVEPLMKRQGIGLHMIRFCEDQARTRGYRDNRLWVLEDNASARAFYARCGYAPDGGRKWLDAFGVYEIRYAKAL